MNGYLKNSFQIVSGFLFSALLLHSCGPKKQEPGSVEKRLLGTWEYAGYRVNGENWNDTAAKYGFNYPIEFWLIYDTKNLDIDHREVRILRDSSQASNFCLCLSYYSITNNNIDLYGYYSPQCHTLPSQNCNISLDQFRSKLPISADAVSSWKVTFIENTLNLSTSVNDNFYEWIFKK